MRVGSLDAPRMAMDRGAKSGVSPAKRGSVMRFPPDRILRLGYSDAQGMDTNPTETPVTRTRIQALARELYVRRGYEGFSFRDIAEALGITRANIHYHFGSKSSLMTALIDDFVADAAQRIARN